MSGSTSEETIVDLTQTVTPGEVRKIARWKCNFCQNFFQTFEEACRHEEICCEKKTELKDKSRSKSSCATSVHPFFQKQPRKRKANAPSSTTTINSTVTINLVETSSTSEKVTAKARKTCQQATMENIFPGVPSKQFMAEQRLAEFQAKRRSKQQQQQQKRIHQQHSQHGNQQQKLENKQARTKLDLWLSFPNPGHVIPGETDASNLPAKNNFSGCPIWSSADNKASRPALKPTTPKTLDPDRGVELPCPLLTSAFLVRPTPTPADLLLSRLATSWFRRTVSSDLPASVITPTMSTLWTDKYSNIDANETKTHLAEFLFRWKQHRCKSDARMAARQKALQRKEESLKKQPSSKRKYKNHVYDDDDLWYDSDEHDDAANRLNSLCVITGPVASGKSALVKTVAQELDCPVLEINTTMERGAKALRKCMEEATQSHSSMDMMMKKKDKCIFLAPTKMITEQRDVEDDASDDLSNNMSSLTVILIDEVDNLFETDSSGGGGGVDSGFWSALSDVYKRSKCPIILTANRLPKKLLSPVFLFLHLESKRPSPTECAKQIESILLAEGYECNNTYETLVRKELEQIAKSYDCDLRRMIHQVQLYLETTTSADTCVTSDSSSTSACPDKAKTVDAFTALARITDIIPKSVAAEDYTLLTLKGEKFLSLACPPGLHSGGYPVNVKIGGAGDSFCCPQARIMDDTTILAVSAPLSVSRNDEPSGDGGKRLVGLPRRLTWEYQPVVVESIRPMGAISSTRNALEFNGICLGHVAVSTALAHNLQFHFTGAFSVHDDEISQEGEIEFEEESHLKSKTGGAVQPVELDWKIIAKLLKKGIDEWSAEGHTVPTMEPPVLGTDITQMDKLALATSLMSDASLLENGLMGTPFLAGAVRGFGFDLTELYPKSTNDISKRPSEETLYEMGWKRNCFFYGQDDSYMTAPTMFHRDVRLLKAMEQRVRGCSVLETFDVEGPEAEDNDNHSKMQNFLISDEDALLPGTTPPCLNGFPIILRQYASSIFGPTQRDHLSEPLFHYDLLQIVSQSKEFLSTFIFATTEGSATAGAFRAGINRLVHPLLQQECGFTAKLSANLMTDYMPILRSIAIHEVAMDDMHKAAIESDPDFDLRDSKRTRTTRRSKRLGREWYLEKITRPWCWDVTQPSCQLVTKQLAKSYLIYHKKT